MAPRWPEEVDVFSVPHSRMKKLVNKYSNMITTTDFRDEYHLKTLLQNLINVFAEFKAHEHIENMFIMRKLRNKLRAASVTSAAVCNCHSDNRLTDMMDLVLDGYKWTEKTERERQLYGRKLRRALEDFTQNFIPHMEEEEEVFQPMLMEYFSYEELKELKAKVIHQHQVSKQQEEYHHEKFVEDFYESDGSCEQVTVDECHFSRLPSEICLKIFSLLGPRDLARASQVSQEWKGLTRDPSLWSRLYPVHWARGNWTFSPEAIGGVDGLGLPGDVIKDEDEQEVYLCLDEDADVDESGDSDGAENLDTDGLKQILKEAKMITAMVKHLLPQVGSGVKVCDLAYSRGISSSLVHKILKLCPNLEILDLTHTKVGDAAFKEYGVSGRESKLRHLDLTGCENITDMTLISLASTGRKSQLNLADRAGFDEDKDEAETDIENVPRPCVQRPPVCCRRSGSCGSSVSTEMNSSGCVMKAVSQGERDIKNCCGTLEASDSDVLNNTEDMKEMSPVLGDTEVVSRVQTTCTEGDDNILGQIKSPADGDPETCDLSYVYLEMLLESEESNSPVEMMSSMLVDEFTNISLSPQMDRFEHSCDTKNTIAVNAASRGLCSPFPQRTCCGERRNPTPKPASPEGPCSTIPQRTCCGERWNVVPCSKKVCCKSPPVRVTTAKSPMPCPAELVTNVCDSSGAPVEPEHQSSSKIDSTEECIKDNVGCTLEFLSLNGCYRITDEGLSVLAEGQGTPHLHHLDLSGCVGVTGAGLSQLVSTCNQLDHSNLYYCDNMSDDPYPTTASGCRNLQCDARFCCSFRE